MLEKIRIVIVDDHQIFRKGLSLLLNELDNIELVAEVSNGLEFLSILETTEFDFVLMDIKMPMMNGIEATKIALQKKPDLKIVALSMFGEEEYLENMLDVGAKGFILKNISKDELERGIKMVMDGNSYFSSELFDLLTKKVSSSSKIGKKITDVNMDKLTKRELEVLNMICKSYSNNEIADKLFISLRTVDGHRANLIGKTGSKNIVSLVTYALRNKLVEIA